MQKIKNPLNQQQHIKHVTAMKEDSAVSVVITVT